MIEIALDEHLNDEFLDKVRPVFKIEKSLGSSLADYRSKAKDLLHQFTNIPIVIVHNDTNNFSINLFALALFIESCHYENNIECVVFKVKDTAKAIEQYKPYVALTIALKYVMRLCYEDVKTIYKEIGNLGYLGLTVTQDYANNKIFISLHGTEPVQKIITSNTSEALTVTGMLKALALAKTGAAIEAEINIAEEKNSIDEEAIIAQIIENVQPWIK